MSAEDKMKNTAEQVKGKLKENVGRATDDKSMQGEGKLDQGSASAKQKVEDVKDSAKGRFAE